MGVFAGFLVLNSTDEAEPQSPLGGLGFLSSVASQSNPFPDWGLIRRRGQECYQQRWGTRW